MFKQREWPFIGESGTQYRFSILPKSKGLPPKPGVFILAYVHPRGHRAGWQVNRLHVEHADDMRAALDRLDGGDQPDLWNCTFVRPEADETARERCAHDLAAPDPTKG